ncbi:hypothetical protein [Streptomyces sp. MST-110588]|uniref:hypothetical protein n=1 Tax=Streptomyces sp. MST-110588 TaxID=2833628 RepID=UPI001F5C13C5|nr:hypothetical protein [Streptomyces sp. MST-110588]UNO43400.1 hypothetical protein KGS77_32875 [Streptomyces sp. MST-110588]
MAREETADEGTAGGSAPASELERLRAEVRELRDRAGTDRRRRARLLAVRRLAAAVVIALVAVLTVTTVVGVWGARTALNTDRWVATVGPLPQDPAVNAAVSTYLTDEIFDRLDVQKRLSDALPPRASFVAAPVTEAVHGYVHDTVSKLLATEQFQSLWRAAHRLAHERITAVLERRSTGVRVQGDTVTLNLLPLVNNALNALEDKLPTLFGKRLDLPEVTSGQIPPKLHDRIEKALGVSLPEDFGQITLYNRHRLGQLQQGVLAVKRGLVALLIATPLLLGLALWVSPDRRRTLLQLGLWLVIGVTALFGVLRAVRNQLLSQVPSGVYRDGVQQALWTIFTTLRDRGAQLLWIGVVLALLMYLVGPGRLPVGLRRHTSRGARAVGRFAVRAGRRVPKGSELRTWMRGHADVLRVAGVIVAALVALLLSSWTSLLVTAVVLAVYEAAVTLAVRDGSSPGPGEAASGTGAQPGAG